MNAPPGCSAPRFSEDPFFPEARIGKQAAGGFLAEPQGVHSILLSVPDYQRGRSMKKKIDVTSIPELRTSVGMHGSLKQKEVGGPVCLGVAIAIFYAVV
jgi:hypothetical protein